MKRKRGRGFGIDDRPLKKSKVDSVSKEEERLKANRSYLQSIKQLLNTYQSTDTGNISKMVDEEEEEDFDEDEMILKTVKNDIMEQKHLKEKKFDDRLLNSEISTPTFFRGHKESPTDISLLTRINSRVVTVSKDNCVLLWDITKSKKKVIKDVSKNRKGLLCVTQSGDGSLICCGGTDGDIHAIDPRMERVVHVLDGHQDSVTDVWMRPNNFELFSSSKDKTIKFWDSRKQTIFQTLYGHVDDVQCVHGIRDQVHVVSGGNDTTVRLWNIERQKQFVFEEGHVKPVDRVRMLHSDCFLSAGEDGSMCFWSTQKSVPMKKFEKAHGGEWVSSMETIGYSNVAFSGSCDGYLRIWKANAGENKLEILRQIGGVKGWVNGIAVEENAKYLVCCVGGEHRLGRWKVLRKIKNGIFVIKLE